MHNFNNPNDLTLKELAFYACRASKAARHWSMRENVSSLRRLYRSVSFAPSGLAPDRAHYPRLRAVGCILSPLRGWSSGGIRFIVVDQI